MSGPAGVQHLTREGDDGFFGSDLKVFSPWTVPTWLGAREIEISSRKLSNLIRQQRKRDVVDTGAHPLRLQPEWTHNDLIGPFSYYSMWM